MGSSWTSYRFDLLNERGLLPDGLALLVDDCELRGSQSVFYKMVVE